MLSSLSALLLISAPAAAWSDCSAQDRSIDYHLTSVCDTWLEGAPAYSATVRASLVAKPASQQVIVFQHKGEWLIRIAGYQWGEDGSVLTRRVQRAMSADDGERIATLLSEDSFKRLSEIHYYGNENVICTDGADYELAAGTNGKKRAARQHSCSGKTEINAIISTFRELALKYDPASDGMLYWMTY